MSSLEGSTTRDEKIIHRIMHEIEERLDINVDSVAMVIEMWENLKDKHKLKRHTPSKV